MKEERLIEFLLEDKAEPLFVTGAGISLASGISTFRGPDPGAIWENEVLEKGTYDFFLRYPHLSWKFYLDRFGAIDNAQPNAAHTALAEIEAKVPSTKVVTQNVDGLHLKAGSKNLIEVHGATRKVRCTNRNCKYGEPQGYFTWGDERYGAQLKKSLASFKKDPSRKNVPRCPLCKKYLRAHVLWFDEYYSQHRDYRLQEVYNWTGDATVIILVGTSNAVSITQSILETALDLRIPVFNVDPHRDNPVAINLRSPAEELLPRIAQAL